VDRILPSEGRAVDRILPSEGRAVDRILSSEGCFSVTKLTH
jgi:hypothetical protein